MSGGVCPCGQLGFVRGVTLQGWHGAVGGSCCSSYGRASPAILGPRARRG